MSYCRFENTVGDLHDCYENWDEVDDHSEREKRARQRLLALCKRIVNEFGEDAGGADE